jgi:hypothetical protein
MLCTSFVALNIRANCCSRPSGTPASPWATASIDFGRDRGSDRAFRHDDAERQVDGDDLPRRAGGAANR